MGRHEIKKEKPDIKVYESVIKKWKNYIYSLAHKYAGKTTMSADDYFQEACLYLWNKKIEGKNSSYIGRMCRTAMSNLYKVKVKRQREWERPLSGDYVDSHFDTEGNYIDGIWYFSESAKED